MMIDDGDDVNTNSKRIVIKIITTVTLYVQLLQYNETNKTPSKKNIN